MIQIGNWNELEIKSRSPNGLLLEGAEYGQILLPNRYVPAEASLGESIRVFLYCDSEDRLVAVTDEPFVTAGHFARLKVVDTNSMGAFLDWGLPKDLLVPYREQKEKLRRGQEVLVHVYLDDASGRLVASSRLNRFLNKTKPEYESGQEVEIIFAYESEMGWNVIIEDSHLGLIFKNESFGKFRSGDKTRAFIKQVRPDGKIDVSLQKAIAETVPDLEELILNKLNEKDGFIPFTDKSPPEVIYEVFGVSKKNFKRAVGSLYKKRKITLESYGIRLNS